MSYTLFIGDVDEYLSTLAKNFDSESSLLTPDVVPVSGYTYYTSLGDMKTLENFYSVCKNADCITYAPPQSWKSKPLKNTQQYWTEYVLTNLSQFITVTGLSKQIKQYSLLPDKVESYQHLSQYCKDKLNSMPLELRKTDDTQIWAVGCSATYGIGVDLERTWREQVRKKLNLQLSNLSSPGTSIVWASNQILQSDVRKGDYVFWGLTLHERFLAVDPTTQSIIHLVASRFEDKHIKKTFPIDYIDSDTTILHNINAIRNVYNFCKQIKAKLVIQSMFLDWDNTWESYNVPCFEQTVIWPEAFVDHGTDNLHPGPKQHTLYAEKFLELAKKWYDQNNIS